MNKIPTIDAILKLLQKGTYKIGQCEFLFDIFECSAIAVSNRFDMNRAKTREETYLQMIKKYDKDTQELIGKIFMQIYIILTNQIDIGFNDYLGELYMKSEAGNKNAGQFFTPYSVSKACAEMTIDNNIVDEYVKSDKILTVNEPACGSGGMILALADILYNKYNFNISRNLFVECSDVDKRCVHMSYLQLGLAGIPAVIYHRDALSMETWDVWKTPAYIIQWFRFRKEGK